VRLLLAVTDWMSESTFGGNAYDTAAALVHVRNAFVATVPIDVSFVLFLMSVMTAVLALVVWVELSLREAAIYVAVEFLPLTFVAMVWQPTAIWCQRLAEGLLSVILSKFVLAASFALAIEARGQADSGQGDGGGFTTMIAGGAAFLIAALTPGCCFASSR
jgi:hypothetical protein